MPIGHVRNKLDKQQVYQAIICEVAICRAQMLKPFDITDQMLLDEDFKTQKDTILVDDRNSTSHPNTQDVIIFHKEQILPLQVIEFSYKKNDKGVSPRPPYSSFIY